MYSQYLEKKKINGNTGVYTKIKIPSSAPILEFGGEIYKGEAPSQDVLQIGPSIYLAPSGNIGDSVRHSCNPNCYVHIVGSRAFLYSTYVVMPDSQITFDYSTNSTDNKDQWSMECNCGSYNCRKIISGFHYLDFSIQEEYKKIGLTPMFMNNNIIMKK